MPQFLAIDWSSHEARFVLASSKGTTLTVEAAQAVSLPQGDGSQPLSPDDIGRALKDALAPHKVGKVKALVSIARGSVELHRLSLPPASDAELPVLVANQILREFATSGEASIVDFVADGGDGSQPRNVTAAVLSSEQHESVRAVCNAAGLTAQRIVLRPYASAALYSLSATPKPATCLLINIVDDEVDLTIVVGDKATFSRTVRFPRTAAENRSEEWLCAEITRTLLAAPQDGAQSTAVSGVCVLGTKTEHAELCRLIHERLQFDVVVLDPFEAIGSSYQSVDATSGRFAPLLGLAAVEARVGSHAIDFINPRKPPQPRNRRRPIIIAASVIAVAALGFGYTVWDELAQDDRRIADLKQELKSVKDQIDKAEKKQAVVDAIADWQSGDVLWLDELRELSQKLPGSRDLTVLRMSMSPARAGGGVITLQGAARSWTVVERMSQSLRDKFHEVGVPHQQGHNQDDARGWHFDTSIAVAKRDKEAYLNPTADDAAAGKETAQNDAAESATAKK